MTQDTGQPPSQWTLRQFMLATLFVVFVIFAFWLLYRFRSVGLLLFIAILIGTGIKYAANWSGRFGIPRTFAVILVYILLIAAVVAFVLQLLPILLEQSTAIIDQISGYYFRFRVLMMSSPSELLRDLGIRISPFFNVEDLVQTPQTQPEPPGESVDATVKAVAQVFSYAGLIGRGLFSLVAVVLISFYWTLEGDRAIRSLLLLAPQTSRESLRELYEAVESRLGGFLLGQFLLCLVVGVMALIAYLLIGLPNALVLAIIAGVLEAVPTLGPALGAIPAILIASSTSPDKVVWVLVATAIIQLLENNLLVPRIMGHSVGVHPLLTLLALATLSSLMGITGALLAVPLAAIFQMMLNRFLIQPLQEEQQAPSGRDYLSYLQLKAQELGQDARKLISQRPIDDEIQEESENPQGVDVTEQIGEGIEALANDINKILAQISPQGKAQP